MSGMENYAFGKIIGEGSYAKVKLCKHIPTGTNVAIKILNKT
jgi:serine/threonine protein kinase